MKKPTEEEIQKALRRIEKMVLDGWSMPYSRRVACGPETSKLTKEVLKRDAYLDILNHYMKGQPNFQVYGRDKNGKIKGVKNAK